MSTSSTKRHLVLYADHEHCLSIYGNTVLSFSLQPPNPSYLAAWTAAMDQLAKRSSGPISVVTIIDSNCQAPDEVSKKAIRDTIVRHGRNICAFGYVVEGQGFGASAVRSAVTLISLMARYPFPQKVFKSIEEAAAWLRTRTPSDSLRGSTAAGMVAAVEAMRYEVQRLPAGGLSGQQRDLGLGGISSAR